MTNSYALILPILLFAKKAIKHSCLFGTLPVSLTASSVFINPIKNLKIMSMIFKLGKNNFSLSAVSISVPVQFR